MRWQVLSMFVVAGVLAAGPASATVLDFSTDPNLGADWTKYTFYSTNTATASWNAANQNLDLKMASPTTDGMSGLYENNATRLATESVTLTLSNYTLTGSGTPWSGAELVISSVQEPTLQDADLNPMYRFSVGNDGTGVDYIVKKANNVVLFNSGQQATPSTIKLDIVPTASGYDFMVNDAKIYSDSTYASSNLKYYLMTWGAWRRHQLLGECRQLRHSHSRARSGCAIGYRFDRAAGLRMEEAEISAKSGLMHVSWTIQRGQRLALTIREGHEASVRLCVPSCPSWMLVE